MGFEKKQFSRNDRIVETLDVTDAGEWLGRLVVDYPLAIIGALLRWFPFVIAAWLVDRYAYRYGFYRAGTWLYLGLILASLLWFIWKARRALRCNARKSSDNQ